MNGARAEFRITDRRAVRKAVSPEIRAIADGIALEAAARAPRHSGDLAAGFDITPGDDPGTWIIDNPWHQFMWTEFGTRRQPARPFLGPVLAAARARWGR